MRLQFAGVFLALISAANAAGVQSKGALPPSSPTPTVYVAPTPMPQAPPIAAAPAPMPSNGLSPLLSQPDLLFPSSRPVGPSYQASPVPAPIDQQKTRSYRNDLVIQRFELDRQGVSPDNERYREIQRQLNQPSSR